jgi:hypothetical protein
MKNLTEDILDPRPLPGVTAYAAGGALQGLAAGLVLGMFLPSQPTWLPWVVVGVAYAVGSFLSVRSFSALKRKYTITLRETESNSS